MAHLHMRINELLEEREISKILYVKNWIFHVQILTGIVVTNFKELMLI